MPIDSIRLAQRESRLNSTHHLYVLEDNWYSSGLLLQSMEFIIYASNMSICEQLRQTLAERCRLSSFEFHYSIRGEQTVQHQIEMNTEHISTTNIYKQIHAQFPSVDTVLLAANDFAALLTESTDHSTMTLRTKEGFDSLHDPKVIDKLLQQQLSIQQICEKKT